MPRAKLSRDAMHRSPRWQVVGGVDKGGIVVRTGSALASEQLPERLATGAELEEVGTNGSRLHFRKLSGDGSPNTLYQLLQKALRELPEC